MRWQSIEAEWNVLRDAVRSTWGLTDNELTDIAGHRDKLCERLVASCGFSNEHDADDAVEDLLESVLGCGTGGWYVPEHP
jgi:uncharacterized protein YjbJ (UPF0337 family)